MFSIVLCDAVRHIKSYHCPVLSCLLKILFYSNGVWLNDTSLIELWVKHIKESKNECLWHRMQCTVLYVRYHVLVIVFVWRQLQTGQPWRDRHIVRKLGKLADWQIDWGCHRYTWSLSFSWGICKTLHEGMICICLGQTREIETQSLLYTQTHTCTFAKDKIKTAPTGGLCVFVWVGRVQIRPTQSSFRLAVYSARSAARTKQTPTWLTHLQYTLLHIYVGRHTHTSQNHPHNPYPSHYRPLSVH